MSRRIASQNEPKPKLLLQGRFVQLNYKFKRFLSARKADLKKGFQHLVVLLVVVVVVGTQVKKRF
jgi:hypothetical protein